MANLEMPLWPEDWQEAPVGTPSAALMSSEDTLPAVVDSRPGGILDGWQPTDWSLADSSLHDRFM